MKNILSKSSHLGSVIFFTIAFVLFALSTTSAGPRQNKTDPRLALNPQAPDATPGSGTLNPSGPAVNWAGAPAIVGVSTDESTCVDGSNCDTFIVTLSGTPADWTGKKAEIKITWPNGNDDFDVFVHKGATNSGALVGSSAQSGPVPEVVDIDPNSPGVGTGQFSIHVVYFTVLPTDSYAGNASVVTVGGPTPTPTPSPGTTPTPTPSAPGTPRYLNYVAPPGYGEDAGEPSIGSNWLTENSANGNPASFSNKFINGTVNPIPNGGTADYYGGFLTEMLQVTFDDCSSPATAFWQKKPLTLAATPRALGDPILFTDHGYPSLVGPGRTFVAQEEVQAGATTDVTDNDGETFMPSQGAGAPAGVDHETVGAGPYSASGITPPSVTPYPPTGPRRAVYYASQSVTDARISRSDDGGITFGPAIPMYTTADCGGLHGHVKVAPDGTVYVPNNACGGTSDPVAHVDGQQAAIVSEDNGITWAIRPVPGSDTKSDRDPSIGIATDGTVYMGMQAADGHARISVSHDKGLTWTAPFDVGAQLGIQNMVFPEVVAGDPNRAAFAFFGTTTGGTNYDAAEFPGVWYLYVSTTFDGGQTWSTQNVTPNDPIQRGGICGSGTCRNLLDFFDITIDKEGRVLIAGEDGCVGGCVNGGTNSFTAKAFISRQSGGKRLLAAFDPVEPTFAQAPGVTGILTGSSVRLSWSEPDNGGSTITAYKVYKGSGSTFALLATVNVPTFTDPNYSPGQLYRVTAVNSSGPAGAAVEGPYCHEFAPTSGPTQTACVLPGIQVLNDVTATGTDNDSAQNTPIDGSVNVKQVYVAEPFVNGGPDTFVFTMQVAPSITGSAPTNSQWFMIWNRQGTDPAHPSDDASYDRMYVAMRTDVTGAPTFEYGKWGVPIDTSGSGVPDPNSNTPQKAGDANSGSYNPLTGVITITLSKSKLRLIDSGAGQYNAGSDLAAFNARTYFNRPDPGQRSQNNASDITDDSTYSIAGNNSCAPVAEVVSAVSRKVHGTAGTFDVKLQPADASNGIECRSGGASGDYQVVISFAAPVTFASATSDAGSVSNSSTNGNTVTVNLTGVPNEHLTTITLHSASVGGAAADVGVPLKVLVGDTNADGSVNSADIGQTKSQSGQSVSGEEGSDNFREDVNADGSINSADVSLVKSKSGTALP